MHVCKHNHDLRRERREKGLLAFFFYCVFQCFTQVQTTLNFLIEAEEEARCAG